MWGPGAQYAKDPRRFTNTGLYVGPWSPVRQGPREIHKYKLFCGALVPSTPRTPRGSQLQAFTWGPGAQYAKTPGSSQTWAFTWGPGAQYSKDPGRFTNTSIHVGPGCPVRQGPREVHKYWPLCGAREPNTPRTPGTNISIYVGPGCLVSQGPREVHKYTLVFGALVPSAGRTPGG